MDFDPRDYDDARDRDDGIYDSRWGEDPRDADVRRAGPRCASLWIRSTGRLILKFSRAPAS